MNNDMTGKVCIVTGANSGIGLETAAGLVQQGATAILACRDEAKAALAAKSIASRGGPGRAEVMPLDLASQESIAGFAREYQRRFQRLDVLVNNAGVIPLTRQTTRDGFEMQFGVNHLGGFRLTLELLGLLKQSAPSRVVVVASVMHHRGKINFGDLHSEQRYRWTTAYGQSKLANVMFTRALARRLEGSGVTVNSLHPGVVRTKISRDFPAVLQPIAAPFMYLMLSPAKGARTSVYLATSREVDGVSGEYFNKCKPARSSSTSQDLEAQERLWEVSAQLTGQRA